MTNVTESLKGESLVPFFAAFKSNVTKHNYAGCLRQFLVLSKLSADEFVELARSKPRSAELLLIQYIEHRKKDKVSGSTINMAKDAVKQLLEMNDIPEGSINWSKVNRVVPRVIHHASDRPPSADEIRRLIMRVGLPMKVIILLLVSSGMRIGSLSYLRWQDIEPIQSQELEFAKVRVYAGEPEEYFSYITPEAYGVLLQYRKVREGKGEKILASSPVVIRRVSKASLAKGEEIMTVHPKTIRNTMGKLWADVVDREKATVGGAIRYEFKQIHGFRKFFKTTCERTVKSIYVEMFLGHTLGISSSYMKPSEEDMVSEYVKAIPGLTILSGNEHAMSRDQTQALFYAQFLKISGWNDEEIKELGDLSAIGEEKFQELLQAKNNEKMGASASGQLVVPVKEIKDYLAKGFEFVVKLSEEEAIVKLPK